MNGTGFSRKQTLGVERHLLRREMVSLAEMLVDAGKDLDRGTEFHDFDGELLRELDNVRLLIVQLTFAAKLERMEP